MVTQLLHLDILQTEDVKMEMVELEVEEGAMAIYPGMVDLTD